LVGALILPLLSRLYPIKKVGFSGVTFISFLYLSFPIPKDTKEMPYKSSLFFN